MEWSLIVGPGARLVDLKAFLVPAAEGGDSTRLLTLSDLGELLRSQARSGRLILSADELELEDAGLVRRFLRRESGFDLVLCGNDPSRRVVRSLLGEARVRWMAWPPDLDDLQALARAPARVARGSPTTPLEVWNTRAPSAPDVRAAASADDGPDERASEPAPEPAPEHGVGHAPNTELEEIEAILGTLTGKAASPRPEVRGARAAALSPHAPLDRRGVERGGVTERSTPRAGREEHATDSAHAGGTEVPSFEQPWAEPPGRELAASAATKSEAADYAPNLRDLAVGATSPSPSAPARPAPYFREQVADLADLVQKLELDVTSVREGAEETPDGGALLEGSVERLSQDVARLLMFTRTLGYLVAPPPAGSQVFDLGELVDLFNRGLRERGDDGPRCLVRKNGAALVRSDRQLVSQTLDALYFLVARCSAGGDVVRVQVQEAAGQVRVSIEFPAGPLAGMEPGSIVEPYALRARFSDLGANALLAAAGIVHGQGGHLELVRRGERHLEWQLDLPLATGVTGAVGRSSPERRPPGPDALDPFA